MNSPGTTPHDLCADAQERSPQGDIACDFCGCSVDDAPLQRNEIGQHICEPCDFHLNGSLEGEIPQ